MMAGTVATRILAAGKSVKVLLVERQWQQHLNSILTQPPCILSAFIEGMTRAAPPASGWGVHVVEIDAQLRRTMLTDMDAVDTLHHCAQDHDDAQEAASLASTRQASEEEGVEGMPLSSSSSIHSSPGLRPHSLEP